MGRRGHEGKFFAVIQPLRQQSSHGLAQHMLFALVLDPQFGGNLRRHGGEMVIQEGRPGLHRIGHIHPIAAPGEDLALQHRFDPHVLGPVQHMALIEL